MYDCIVFDLDGTLTDPAVGIAASLNYSLFHHNYPERTAAELSQYIGPPLDQAFIHLTGSSDQRHIHSLVAKYRERYSTIGYAENRLYDGIPPVLQSLAASGIKLGVCTSKRADFAEKILALFHLRQHFAFVHGGDIGITKDQQLASLLRDGLVSARSIMVGDRAVDLASAHQNGLASAGVLWGYGSTAELSAENPRHLFHSPSELLVLSA
jgi:phosphoglycolate phosphatase